VRRRSGGRWRRHGPATRTSPAGSGWRGGRRWRRRGLIALRNGALGLTRRGQERFESLRLRVARWPEGKPCLDWTERKHHLGGALGALLTRHLFELRWLARREGDCAVRLTVAGTRELDRRFGVRVTDAG